MAQNTKLFKAPDEPALEMDDIQGAVVPGFLKPHHTLLGLRIPDGIEVVRNFKAWLIALTPDVSTARQTLDDRRAYRKGKPCLPYMVGIGFSAVGLVRLTPGASMIPDDAFQAGLVVRSKLLGDPVGSAKEGDPVNWIVGGPGAELDALVLVAGTGRGDVTKRADHLESQITAAGVSVVYREDGDVRPGKEKGHEHFGFDDGVSQPGIRGRASNSPTDFITERKIDPSEVPEAWLFGYPGQDLVWPGEFVIGYAKTSPDPFLPGPSDPPRPEWTRNGSFLVFRRLRQDVGLFWRTMRSLAESLRALPGFGKMSDQHLASLLVGRWPSGAPVNRTPAQDIPDLGRDVFANNHFQFDSDTSSLKLVGGRDDPFPQAKADPAGTTCPWAAHIRKVNTRDSASDMGGRDSTYNRRLLRVGVPFGKQLDNPYSTMAEDPEKGNRGLLFLSIQASIENQFEFLMANWINDPTRPKTPGGNDMLIGQNAAAADGVRRCSLFGAGLQQAELSAEDQWVIATGGGYFFMPSISALRDIITR